MRLTLQLTQLGIEVKCRTQSGNFSALQTDVLHYLADAMGQRVTVASMPAAERGMFKHYLADAMGQRVTVASMPAAERGMFKHYLADAMGQRVTVASMPAAERGMFKHYLADAMGQRVTVASMPAAERGMFKHPAHAVAFFHIVNTPDTIRTLNKTAAEFGFVVEVL